MAKLLDENALGPRPDPRPSMGLAQYKGDIPNLEAPGQAMSELGREVVREFQIYQEKADTTRVEDAWNQYKKAALEETHGEDGILKKRGGDAVNGNILQRSEKNLGAVRDRILQSLANDDQRKRFGERAAATDLQVRGQALTHLEAEHREYDKSVMMGSEGAARTQIKAMPESGAVFDQARDTLMRQADTFLTNQGVTDASARQAYKDKVVDGLWATRIDELLYSKPILAEALLRANEKEIKSPELRLTLQAKTREAALSVSASMAAQAEIDDYRSRMPPAPAAGNVFQTVVGSTLKREGGYVAKDGKSGAPANFGINQAANKDVDVKNLTRDQAIELYRTRYWDKIDGDSLAPSTALVAFDTAVLQGVDVAKKLVADTQGDPRLMIARRREQLQALAAKDPEHAKQLAGWMARLDSLQSEVLSMGEDGMRAASMRTPGGGANDPFTQNTNGLPLARDVAAQLPFMLLGVEKRADAIYGPDKGNPDRQAFVRRTTAELQAKVAADVQQLGAIQKQAQGVILDAITGMSPVAGAGGVTTVGGGGATGGGRAGTPGVVITSFSEIQANPVLFASWLRMDPTAKVEMARLMEFNQRAQGKGNQELYWATFNRIHLPVGDRNKIEFPGQIVALTGPGKLSRDQLVELRQEIDRAETPGGQSAGQMRVAAGVHAKNYFERNLNSNLLYADTKLTNPGAALEWANNWQQAVGRKVDEYINAGTPGKVRMMFMTDTLESVVKPEYLQTFMTKGAGTAETAAAVRAGDRAPLADRKPAEPPAVMPATIKTREERDAWIKTLAPSVTTFRGADGNIYNVPGRAAPAQPGAAPAVAGTGFNPEGVDYDMAGAKAAGLKPDATGHWPSRDPATGLLLKGRGHETWAKTIKGERAAGMEIFKGQDGRYYSRPAQGPVMDQTGKLVQPPASPPPAAAVKPKDELPVFKKQRGPDPQDTENHLGGLWAAAKAVGGALFQNPLEVGIIGGTRELIGKFLSLRETSREDVAKAVFLRLLQSEDFTPEDVPVVRAAIQYGNLDPPELKKAKAMLKAAGEK